MTRRNLIFAGALLALLLAFATHAAADDPLQTAQQQFARAEFAAAVKTLEPAVAQKPQDAPLHYWLGRAYYELRDVNRAFEHLERAAALGPDHSDYHLWYGHACGRRARRESSLGLARRTKREFEAAVRLDPRNIPAQRALIDYLSSAPWIAGGSDGEARKLADALLAADPVEGRLAWADYWINNDEPARATAEFLKMLELQPARSEPYGDAMRFFVERQDAANLDKALTGAERANAAEPWMLFYRSALWVLQGVRAAEAEQSLQKYISSVTPRTGFPSHAQARLWLGRLYENQHRCEAAANEYREILKADAKHREAIEALKRATQKCK